MKHRAWERAGTQTHPGITKARIPKSREGLSLSPGSVRLQPPSLSSQIGSLPVAGTAHPPVLVPSSFSHQRKAVSVKPPNPKQRSQRPTVGWVSTLGQMHCGQADGSCEKVTYVYPLACCSQSKTRAVQTAVPGSAVAQLSR